MKIFTENKIDTSVPSSETKINKGPTRKKTKTSVEKKNVSPEEIRQKLADHVELSNTGKQASNAKFQQKLGDGFLNENKKPIIQQPTIVEKLPSTNTEEVSDDPNPPGHLLKSDVGSNSPNAEETTKKLKTVLEKGAFNFNPKERDVLDRILSER